MNSIFSKLLNIFSNPIDKNRAEECFWKNEIENYVLWYNGDITKHYGVNSPNENQKIKSYNIQQSALLTWFELHQKEKYLIDLNLQRDSFRKKIILDIGSGPFPSAECFEDIKLYCLEPLIPEYIKVGYPIHCYRDSTKFVCGLSEKLPFSDNFFDAVISMNAIDHVDDLFRTSKEIHRVLKKGGELRIHAHYHLKTTCEPIELNDVIMGKAFSWCDNFSKINEAQDKLGAKAGKDESYALWSNF